MLWLKRKRLLPVAVYYLLWEVAAARRARDLGTDIDIVHHVTFNGFRFPGMWWGDRWRVVLGPLGGASIASSHYRRCFGGRHWWREWLRGKTVRWWRLYWWTWSLTAPAGGIGGRE